MNVCFAIDLFPPQIGGIATFYRNLATLLTENGHDVIILKVDCKADPNDSDIISKEDNITKVTLKSSYFKYYNYYKRFFSPGGLDAPYWIAMGLAMREWLLNNYKDFEIKIIETTDYGGLGVFLLSGELPPLVISGHGCLTQLSRFNSIIDDAHTRCIKKLEEASFWYADAIIAHSPLNQQQLINWLNRDVYFATCPWIPINVVELSKNPLVCVGGLQKIKGAITAAEAMQIVSSHDPELKLRWIGDDTHTAETGSMASWLKKHYSSIWNKSFIWIKEKDNQATLKEMASSSIIVVPSIWESFNYTTLEAASLAKPVIMTSDTGAAYLFKHKYDAWIIPPDNPKELAEAIIYLSGNPEVTSKLGSNAQLIVSKVFDGIRITEERVAIYRQIISKRKKPTTDLNENIKFLKHYLTRIRMMYYWIRSTVKEIVKG